MNKVTLLTLDGKRQHAAKLIGVNTHDLNYCVFSKIYGSTSGPFGGIGGAAMTPFQLDAFYDQVSGEACIFCGDQFIKKVKNFQISVVWK